MGRVFALIIGCLLVVSGMGLLAGAGAGGGGLGAAYVFDRDDGDFMIDTVLVQTQQAG